MKQGFCLLLAVALACISVAGCSTPGQGQSSWPSGLQSQSSAPNAPSAPPLQASSQGALSASSSLPESPSNPYPDWHINGRFPTVSEELAQYYEERPLFKQYFKAYLAPLDFLEAMQWPDNTRFTEKQLSQIANWAINKIPDEVIQTLPEVGALASYPGDWVEKIAQQYFGIAPQTLRTAGTYQPETHTYQSFAIGFGAAYMMVITDAYTNNDELVLTFSYFLEHNFPTYTKRWQESAEGVYEMHIRLNPDETFQWLWCTKTQDLP